MLKQCEEGGNSCSGKSEYVGEETSKKRTEESWRETANERRGQRKKPGGNAKETGGGGKDVQNARIDWDLMRGWAYGGGHTTRQPKELENNASTAAASRRMWFVRVFHWGRSDSRSTSRADILLFLFKRMDHMSAPPSRSNWGNPNLVVLPDLTNNRVESFINIDGLFGGCLHEDASEVFCQVTTLCVTS